MENMIIKYDGENSQEIIDALSFLKGKTAEFKYHFNNNRTVINTIDKLYTYQFPNDENVLINIHASGDKNAINIFPGAKITIKQNIISINQKSTHEKTKGVDVSCIITLITDLEDIVLKTKYVTDKFIRDEFDRFDSYLIKINDIVNDGEVLNIDKLLDCKIKILDALKVNISFERAVFIGNISYVKIAFKEVLDVTDQFPVDLDKWIAVAGNKGFDKIVEYLENEKKNARPDIIEVYKVIKSKE
jgi:hypothetical protein